MIPLACIQAWQEHALWPIPAPFEQDLMIFRELGDLLNARALARTIAFLGNTATQKLAYPEAMRSSEPEMQGQ